MKGKYRFAYVLIALTCVGQLIPKAFGVTPPPDGCYPNFTTAEGCKALQSLTTGVANTGIGWYSLFANSAGSYNTAVGAGALDLNIADNNTAVGVAALLLNTSGTNNTANGTGALVFNDTGEGNTATGAFALYSNTNGQFNTANGEFALHFNTTGERNTAIGDSALYQNTEGNRNSALGNTALLLNSTGNNNVAVGAGALQDNNNNQNVAVGVDALSDNTDGFNNTAAGFRALFSNTEGAGNTAIGVTALTSNTTGSANTVCGLNGLRDNVIGSFNTAMGDQALFHSTGEHNTALGFNAGQSVTNANNVIVIGTDGANVNDSCYVGNIFGQPGGSQAVYINSDGKLGAQVSSRRFKDEIKPMEQASEVIYRLKPVSFRYKEEIESTRLIGFGLIAEEVQAVNPDLVARDSSGKAYSVRYDQVNAMLLNEFLKEHQTVKAQQKEIDALKQELKDQKALIEKVTARLDSVNAGPQLVADKL